MIYNVNNCDSIILDIKKNDLIEDKKRKCFIYQKALSFDIETSSFYKSIKKQIDIDTFNNLKDKDKKEYSKICVMYIWQFAIENNVIIGRTWNEFFILIEKLKNLLELSDKKIICVYVHNLSYEFQFIRKYFTWLDVFALEKRKVVYALTKGILFRCSYILSGYSLDTVAKNLTSSNIKKLVGNLDYKKIRSPETQLTKEEIEYCINDVLILNVYINECIERFNDIVNIPNTQTGIVRRFVKSEMNKNRKDMYKVQSMTLEIEEYQLLKRAFSGGFTHSNGILTDCINENVSSFDFTSSYPTVLISEKYPMSKGKRILIENKEHFYYLIKNFCCVFNIIFHKIKNKFLFEQIISRSKCFICENASINNGRIVNADKIGLSITNIDFEDICKFYDYEEIEIRDIYIYEKNYLPKCFIETILQLYEDKTKLKGVNGKEVEYLHSKEMLNSLYGMCVTDINRDNIIYECNEWRNEEKSIYESIENYNKDKTRVISYIWGVFCTSYARHNLYSGILEFKNDYIYSDTDSIKVLNKDNHSKYFDDYNNNIIHKLENCCNYHQIDISKIKPKTIKNIEKPLGVWDYEGTYKKFKTLGAKRYLYLDDDLHLTVSGLNKKIVIPFLFDTYKTIDNIFNNFKNGLYVKYGFSGKLTHTYIDEEKKGVMIDYQNNYYEFSELSSIHLSDSDYLLSLSNTYIDYLLSLKNLMEIYEK